MSDEQPQKQGYSDRAQFFSTAQGRVIALLGIVSLMGGIAAEGVSIWRNINETITSREIAVNAKARQDAEAKQARDQECIARMEKATKYATLEELLKGDIDLGDCDPHYEEKKQARRMCTDTFMALLDKDFPAKGFLVNGKTLDDDMTNFKKNCQLTPELNEALKARAGVIVHRIQDFEATDEGKACHADMPKMIAELRSTGPTERFNAAFKKHLDTCPPMTTEEKALFTSALDEGSRTAKEAAKEAIKLKVAASAEKDKGNYDHAFELQKQYAAAAEAFEVKNGGKAGDLTGGAYLDLSFYALFAKRYQSALDAADRAIELRPNDLVPVTNRTHALMFLGRIDEARTNYLAHRGEKMRDHDWNYNILDDFKQLRKAGVSHPLMDEIESVLQQPGEKTVVADPAALKTSAAQADELNTYRVVSELRDGRLSLRDGPGIRHAKLAEMPAGDLVRQLAPCVNSDDGVTTQPWCKVDYNGTTGWASMSGLQRVSGERTEPAQFAASSQPQDLQQRVRSFLNAYHDAAAKDMRQLGRFYAATVDYGRKGIISRDTIMREKLEVEQVCPRRAYRILNDNFSIQPAGPNRVDVQFDVDTVCSGGQNETRRVWQSFVTIDFSSETPLIVAQKSGLRQSN